jgi:hypothetical protein
VDFVYEHKDEARASRKALGTVLDRGAQAVACGSCLSQVLGRGAQAAARGAVPCASQGLERGDQASAWNAACGDATLSQQKKNTRQMSRGAE